MEATGHLERVLSDTTVRVLAGERYYQRGRDYFQRRRVKRLERFGDTLEALVAGTENYTVVFTATAKDFEYRCDCPLGEDGAFCKHCVAAALAWLQGEPKTATAAVTNTNRKAVAQVTDEDVARALELEEKATLIRWLLEWSEQEEGLRRRLMLLAAGRKGTAVLAAQVRRSLEQAIRIRGHIGYDEMRSYAARVKAEFTGVEALLQQGDADAVMDLCEAGTRWLGSAVERMDDSDGHVSELMGRMEELHLRACEQAQPDEEALAAKLFALELRGEYGEWSNMPQRYAHVLGAKGLAAFRTHAGREWAKVPVRTQPGGFASGENNRYRLTAIMESLALQSGDVEELVAVLERDLSSAHSYQRIATTYRDAGKHDKALSWAERGVAVDPGHAGAGLRLFVAEEYQRNERHAEAMRIVWLEFRDRPGLAAYKLLQKFAEAAEDWDEWREQALTHVRAKIAGPAKAKRADGAMVSSWRNRKQDHSLLVEIFLYERNIESAWREAQSGGCADNLWLTLAGEREKHHPADAVPIYLRLGEQAIVEAASSRYQPAVELFERAATLMRSLGRSEEFEREFDALRQRYKAKRNLQKLAEARREFLYRI